MTDQRQSAARSALVCGLLTLLNAAATARSADLAAGLVGEYYTLKETPHDFPSIAEGEKPFLVRVDKQVNFPATDGNFYKTKLAQNFFAVWRGVIRVEKAGSYTFTTASDDGSRLFIDDKQVIDNGGAHGAQEKSGEVELTPGDHAIRVEFFQGGGGAQCVVSWKTPGAENAVIPANVLFHEKAAEAVKWDAAAWKKARTPGRGGDTGGPTPWDNLDYGPFLSLTATAPAPADNVTYKAVAVKLGTNDEASVMFDTQLMRMSAGWTGGFLRLTGVAYTGGHGINPSIAGQEKFGTRNAPGWAHNGSFKDPRPEPFGGMPRDYMHYRGLYRSGDRLVFSYTIGDAEILETPNIAKQGENVAFTRTFQVGPSKTAQEMVVCEADNATGGVGPVGQAAGSQKSAPASGNAAVLESGTVTAVGVIAPPAGATLSVVPGAGAAGIHLALAPHADTQRFTLVIWNGEKDQLHSFGAFLAGKNIEDVTALCKGGPAHWPEEIATVGDLAVDPKDPKAAYVLDELTPPKPAKNAPQIRLGGFDFFPDGKSAALCTWNGDVYVVKGIDDRIDHLTWRRIAGGMFQTLGLKIVGNDIYVMGRDQITILHDLNGDGEADFYENFNNDVTVAPAFHEFAFDLDQDAEGNFYFCKAGGVRAGGRGFETPITADQGTVMKVSKDGSKLETVCGGLRAPNGMCVGPDGQIVTGDNQGSWTPVDRINWVKPGGFYGVPELSHRNPLPNITDNPLCWLIYPGWDNSCGDPIFVPDDRWGPFKGELMYLSYGKCSLFTVLKEEAGGEIQGGVARFPLKLQSGSMRCRFNPVDGQLYVCGFRGWQTDAPRETAFERVRYTGKPVYLPKAMHVKDNGIEITFFQPLAKDTAADAGSWSIEQWNYKWASEYGSHEFSANDPKKEGHDTVEVKSAKLSDDGKTVFLEVPKLRPVMQMLIQGNIDAADGTPMEVRIANTINYVNGQKLVVKAE